MQHGVADQARQPSTWFEAGAVRSCATAKNLAFYGVCTGLPQSQPPLNLVASFAIRGVHKLRGPTRPGLLAPGWAGACSSTDQRARLMSTTFDKVAEIIAETCDIPRENIKPESHAINDLEIDSLDFLDIAFAIDKAFGIKLPLEQWTQEVNDGKASTDQYFVLKNLCERIDELIAAKGA
jgi:acyl carrier protein